MVITQVSVVYQHQQVVVAVRGALTHQVQVEVVAVLDKQAAEPMLVELPALLVRVIMVVAMAASIHLTIQVVVAVVLALLVELPQMAALLVLVEQVKLGLTVIPMLEVAEVVITPMLEVEQADQVVAVKVVMELLKIVQPLEQSTLVVVEVVMEELDLQVVVVLLSFAIQVAKLDQVEQLHQQVDTLTTHSQPVAHSQVKGKIKWLIMQD
jgi:hypothetical protein